MGIGDWGHGGQGGQGGQGRHGRGGERESGRVTPFKGRDLRKGQYSQ
jgi:hypothetical protein